jgi:YggT family protein
VSGGYLSEAGIFLVSTVFDLYIMVVALRFLLQLVRADFYNPISQFIVTLTNPPLRYLRRWIPGYAGVDWACLLLLFGVQILELTLISLIGGQMPSITGLLVLSLASLVRLGIYIMMFAIIVQVIISWVAPGAYNPLTVLLYRLTDFILRPARRLLPPVSGVDFSPWLVLVALQLGIILIVKPLLRLGYILSGYVI